MLRKGQADTIVVLDFGGQYTHLIARRIREFSVYSEILSPDTSLEELRSWNPKGFILSGGPSSVFEPDAPTISDEFFEYCLSEKIPILGICYGQQLIASKLGNKVISSPDHEYGKVKLSVQDKSDLLAGLSDEEIVWMSHGDKVESLTSGFQVLGSSSNCPVAAFKSPSRQIYAIQFHLEVHHTVQGKRILQNFLFDICKCRPNWIMEDFIQTSMAELKERIGPAQVIMGVSGGVDSSVAATLIHRAIGDQLHCIFVDNGLLRKGEVDEVKNLFTTFLKFKHFNVVDASETFLTKLKGVTDPEEKRRIIGHAFIEVFEQKALELKSAHGEIKFLGQGTIAPDRIESGATSGSSAVIKSHHNLTLPEKMNLEIIEPLMYLYKDEVRTVGRALGLSDVIISRHPFPGPSLAIRIIGEITPEKLAILRESDAIVIEEIQRAGLYKQVWQAFAAFLPIRSVGVMGDARTYDNMILVRIVESQDAMTANFAKIDWDVLEIISSRIVNEVKHVNRVVYDISNKPPATVELE